MNILKQLYLFFASVQLAIFTLTILAISSIIGTIIPQGEVPAFYVRLCGEKLAQFIQLLDIPRMYTSWWFIGLLGILAINLVVCSIKRFPLAWKIIHRDNLAATREQLEKKPISFHWQSNSFCAEEQIVEVLRKEGWNHREQKKSDGNTLLFFQKGRWSRLGVYLVHLSIIIIFIGALTGHIAGFRASALIGEGQGTDTVYTLDEQKPLPLGFTIHCNAFFIESYATGMPKEYRSDLSILDENNTLVKRENIRVNNPFTYNGITFYQSSYEGFRDFLVTVTDEQSGEHKIFQIPFQRSVLWQEKALSIGILNVKSEGMRVIQEKLWFKIGDTAALTGWIADNTTRDFSIKGKRYRIKVKQRYATGLQVSKDPGIWLIYLGCLLMLGGLYMAFFMSHRRVWLLLSQKKTATLLLAADTNKNQRTMKKKMVELSIQLQELSPHLEQ